MVSKGRQTRKESRVDCRKVGGRVDCRKGGALE